MDYEALEGTEIDVKVNGFNVCGGFVVGCDPDVGVSVVKGSDHSDHLVCIVGPSSPNYPWKGDVDEEKRAVFTRKVIAAAANMISDGYIDTEELTEQVYTEHYGPLGVGTATPRYSDDVHQQCPFNQ